MVLREITDRHCVRNYSGEKVPDEIIKNILEAARLAPSWMNTQPWHFIVVQDEKKKFLLSQLSQGQPHVEKASAVIVCCGDKNVWEEENFRKTVKSKKGITPERVEILLKNEAFNPTLRDEATVTARTLEGLTYAIAYMTLEAKHQGVGACVIGAMGNDLTGAVPEVYELARNTLQIPDDFMIMAMLTIGYEEKTAEKPEKTRKSFDEVISWEIYGKKK